MERSCLGSEGDNSSGFLWPQRNYTCSFCKRQFNSAQALGGHMNVHRRDRAMLIQLPSWVFHQYPNPNPKSHPKPKFSSSSTSCSASTLLPYNYTHHRFLSPSSYEEKKPTTHIEASAPLSEDLTEKMKKKNMTSVVEVEELKEELEVFKKSELISLDLEIGCKDPKEVLDLELRLGCF